MDSSAGADQGRMALLFAEQLECRGTFRHFAGEFEPGDQHDGDEADAENDDQHQETAGVRAV